MGKEELLKARGVVKAALSNDRFRVLVDGKHEVIASVSGKIRRVRIQLNDIVELKITPYDPSKGIITFRYKGKPHESKVINKEKK